MAWTATGRVSAYAKLPPSRGRPGNYFGCILLGAIFARLRAAAASALLAAVLALGAAPSPNAQGQAPSSWVFDYVNFVTRSDGWAMATNQATQNGFAELLTSQWQRTPSLA